MSGRFVSGGTIGSSSEPPKDEATERLGDRDEAAPAASNPEWEAVQRELEADRKRRQDARVKAAAGEERSLYDILQDNKGSCPLWG